MTRDRLAALTRVLRRRQTLTWLSTSGRMNVAVEDGVVTFVDGRLLLGDPELDLTGTTATERALEGDADTHVAAHLDRRTADELLIVARWLDREIGAGRARLLDASGTPSSPRAGALPRYEAAPRRGIRRGR
jgi:hypothetical protein